MELSERISQFITEGVAGRNPEGMFREPLIGFSSADDPLYQELKTIVGPHHLLPRDLLPQAQTVISFFIPFTKAVAEANRGTEPAEAWAGTYIACNRLINTLSEELVAWLSAVGYGAETVRATHTFDTKTLQAPWSHRSAAFIAGLGRFGRNRLLITPKGCAGRFGTVVTSALIPAGKRPEEEYCLYYRSGKCSYCFDHCPMQALGESNAFDKHKCHDQLLAVDAAFPHLETCDVCGKCAVGPCAVRE